MKRPRLYRRFATIAAVTAATVLLLACGCTPAEDSKDDDGSGGSATATGTGGAGAMGGHSQGGGGAGSTGCNQLSADGPEVAVMQVAELMPAAVGGRIEPGSFQLTSATAYTGPGGATGPTGARQRERAEYGEEEVQIAVDLFQGEGDQHFTLSFAIDDGGAISFQGTCPGPLNFPYDRYTVGSADSLTLYSTSAQQELSYTRAP